LVNMIVAEENSWVEHVQFSWSALADISRHHAIWSTTE
jgi:hypothetical protein